ncbi:MAG: ATP-dependent Clp protease proteolytic subunit [Candidatus Omnitrophica bacterium]|nr:ATP-dependent Clp protease proteolytic subunit [Candidatus Omnitrophota bacterium]
MREVFYTTDLTFENVQNFLAVKPQDNYRLYFSTDGGNTYSAFFLAKVLADDKYLQEIICVGDVASGGIVVLVACKNKPIYALPYVVFILHSIEISYGSSDIYFSQNFQSLQKTQKLNEYYINFIKSKTNLPSRYITLLKNGSTIYLSPEEAIRYGIIHKIIDIGL